MSATQEAEISMATAAAGRIRKRRYSSARIQPVSLTDS